MLALLLLGALVLLGAGAAAAAATRASAGTRRMVVSGVRGKRYCELLLVHGSAKGLVADVYNTFGQNSCPAASWQAIDVAAVAKANHDIAVVANGPRFWLMDTIVKLQHGPQVLRRFGGLTMTEEATVAVGSLSAKPFTVHRVDRTTEFDFARGHTVYELVAPHGQVWVMQSWSEQVQPGLRQSALAHLASRLTLPPGWRYRVRRLARPLRVVTVHTAAQVIQDNLDNSYSRIR
jgi:hypothetical protein